MIKITSKILPDIQPTLGRDAPSNAMICLWAVHFNPGDISLEDEEPPEPPERVTILEMVQKAHSVVLSDRRVKVEETAKTVIMSTRRRHHIFHIEVSTPQVSDSWAPSSLNAD